MAVDDLWVGRDGQPTARNGRGMRWRVRVPGYPVTSCRTKAEAERVNAQRLLAGPPRPESSVTVGDLLDRWLAGKRRLSPAGYEACRFAAAQVRARWGLALAGSVTTPLVQEWLSSLESVDAKASAAASRAAGRRVQVMRPAAAGTRHKALQALRGALQVAVASGWLEANPCVGVAAGRQTVHDARFLSPAEVRRLAEAAGEDAPLVWLLATTGLRIGEAVALDVGDVDASRGRLRVRRSKNGRARDVPVPASVLAMLDLGRDTSEPLLLSAAGVRLRPDNWRARTWRQATVAAGLEGLRIHDLRHTAASLAIASGADVKVVQRMLGHASAAMTLDRYGHLWDRGLDDVAARMEGLLA